MAFTALKYYFSYIFVRILMWGLTHDTTHIFIVSGQNHWPHGWTRSSGRPPIRWRACWPVSVRAPNASPIGQPDTRPPIGTIPVHACACTCAFGVYLNISRYPRHYLRFPLVRVYFDSRIWISPTVISTSSSPPVQWWVYKSVITLCHVVCHK